MRKDFWIEIDQDSGFNNLFFWNVTYRNILKFTLHLFLKSDYSAEVTAVSAVPAQSTSSSALIKSHSKSVYVWEEEHSYPA